MTREKIVIIGAGAAGLSAALTLAKQNCPVLLISGMPSFRAQSVMAAGGMNAALDTMEEGDSPELHAVETLKAGRFLADPEMVTQMTEAAPGLIEELYENGMCLNETTGRQIALRSFGGQTKKRTAYASSSTGKQMMHTLISMLRKYEISGMVERMEDHHFLKAKIKDETLEGCYVYSRNTKEVTFISCQRMIIASGGLNGLFGNATGSVMNSGAVTASLFTEGVKLANGEMIQYHPTTVRLSNKNLLISEAARGEGGRLYILKDEKPYYFMEEKYPDLGNLMPRDVIAKEEYQLIQEGYQIYLDLTELSSSAYEKLDGVVSLCRDFLHLDVREKPIPVEPGIHYFMGGILVDQCHRTNIKGLYAAGECACAYHGANRLGGNSLLGALYGGQVAAKTAMNEVFEKQQITETKIVETAWEQKKGSEFSLFEAKTELQTVLKNALGIFRDEHTLQSGIEQIRSIMDRTKDAHNPYAELDETIHWQDECILGMALLESALMRKESRGAHNRVEYPKEDAAYEKLTVAHYTGHQVNVSFQKKEVTNADQSIN